MRIQDYIANPQNREKSFARVREVQAKLNATISFPAEDRSEKSGRLAGVPIAVKDNFNVLGTITTAGSRILDNYQSIYDATVIEKLKAEGAVIVAKTSMDELGMGGTNLTSFIGPCHNPYDLQRISGGSSGGSAVLVASGAVPVALGTDTGDSVRKPASFNGIIGVKPSYGRISRYGVIPYASSLDHVGYFTNNVADAAFMLEILAGRDDRDMTSSFLPVEEYSACLEKGVAGKKLLLFGNVLEALKDAPVKELFMQQVEHLKAQGAIIKTVTFDTHLMRALLPVYYIIANAEATANHSNLTGIPFGHRVAAASADEIMIATRTRGFGSAIKKRFVIGSYALHEENQEKILRKAQKVRRLIVEAYLRELREADAILAPASSGGAPLIAGQTTNELSDEYLIADNHMVIGNFAGLPSLTLPMGEIDHLPVGLNITCNPFAETTMFQIARQLEKNGCLVNLKEDF